MAEVREVTHITIEDRSSVRPTDGPMLVHTVYFWLKPELTAQQHADFIKGVGKLAGIKAVEQAFVGQPAKTEKRPIIDDSYSVALTVICQDIAGHDLARPVGHAAQFAPLAPCTQKPALALKPQTI